MAESPTDGQGGNKKKFQGSTSYAAEVLKHMIIKDLLFERVFKQGV